MPVKNISGEGVIKYYRNPLRWDPSVPEFFPMPFQ
jgi:hypothetical protein